MSMGGNDDSRLVQFPLSATSALKIQKGDITKWFVDASTDAIQYIELLDRNFGMHAIKSKKFVPEFAALLENGFKLPASHVVHTVGPVYNGEDPNTQVSLRNAYINSLRVAKDTNINYIAFPAISCGVYRYPFDEAASVAISSIKEFDGNFKEVHFVLFSDEIYDAWLNKASELLPK